MIKIEPLKLNRSMFAISGNLKRITKDGLRRGLQRSGMDIIGKKNAANDGLVKQQMNAPKSGRTYKTKVGKTGRKLSRSRLYTASAVGQSPAVVSGALRKSTDFTVIGGNRLEISANTPYARILEQGGTITWKKRSGSARIARRNYLRRPILQSRRNIIRHIKQAITEFGK
jgi:hypothetical protein